MRSRVFCKRFSSSLLGLEQKIALYLDSSPLAALSLTHTHTLKPLFLLSGQWHWFFNHFCSNKKKKISNTLHFLSSTFLWIYIIWFSSWNWMPSQNRESDCEMWSVSLGHFGFHWKNAANKTLCCWSNLSWQVFFIFCARTLQKFWLLCIHFLTPPKKVKKCWEKW